MDDDDDFESDGSGPENGNGGISSIFTRFIVGIGCIDRDRCFNRMYGVGLEVRNASCVLSVIFSSNDGAIVRPLMIEPLAGRNIGGTASSCVDAELPMLPLARFLPIGVGGGDSVEGKKEITLELDGDCMMTETLISILSELFRA